MWVQQSSKDSRAIPDDVSPGLEMGTGACKRNTFIPAVSLWPPYGQDQ